ncbi:NAD(P)/FAD-dependent oxidoreductase [Albidovulum sp.]|uniref:NAD(P)/FAD-dependent oxidoreductase n=1 Tax=Albidovulum sp. TaxID=1872424 RepID=UPI0039B9A5BA
MDNWDIIVVGAGLIGLSTAYRARKAGARVLVIDRGAVAYEASSRATGYLSLRGESPEESPLAQMAEKLWPTLDEELGYPTEWKQKGRLWAAFDDHEVAELRGTYRSFQKTDIKFDWIDTKTCREIIPILSPEVKAGIYTERAGHANPQRVSQAFAWAFEDLGGTILEHTPVYEVLTDKGQVTGVRTKAGDFHSGRVVLAAAAFNAKLLAPFGILFPVAPVRLEALVTTPLPPAYDVCFIGNGISIRQTLRGNLHANGGPSEWVDVSADQEPAKPNTPIIRNVVRRMIEAFPTAASLQLLRCWAGVVEITPDQMTIVESFGEPKGLVAAAGAGHAFGMAPSLGVALAELALEGKTQAPIEHLRLNRFADLGPDWRAKLGWRPGDYNT